MVAISIIRHHSIYKNSNSLGVPPEIRNEEIMHYFCIGVVGLVQLELKATRRKNCCNSEVKLAVC